MLIISEDSTATYTRYLPAGSAGSSILNGLAPLEVSVPLQFKLPLTSIVQEPFSPPALRAKAPVVNDLLNASRAALVVSAAPVSLTAWTPQPSTACPNTPTLPGSPATPWTPMPLGTEGQL